MCLGILLVCEMHIICGHHFYAMLLTHLEQEVIHFNLKRICVAVGIFLKCKMPLEFKVIIIAKSLFIPKNPFLGRLQVVMNHKLRHISTYASRTHYQPFGMESKLLTVCARLIIVAVSPCLAHEFNKVVITLIVFCKNNKMRAVVAFVFPVGHLLPGHIHFTADNRLELLFIGLSSVLFIHIIIELLDAKHIAMVSKGNALHSVADSLVDKFRNRCLPVKKAILRVDV